MILKGAEAKVREKNVSWLHLQHTLQLEDSWTIYYTLSLVEKAWSDKRTLVEIYKLTTRILTNTHTHRSASAVHILFQKKKNSKSMSMSSDG